MHKNPVKEYIIKYDYIYDYIDILGMTQKIKHKQIRIKIIFSKNSMNEWGNYFPENNKSNHASLTNNDLENIKEINEFFIKKNTNSLICLNVTTKKKFLIVNHHNKKI